MIMLAFTLDALFKSKFDTTTGEDIGRTFFDLLVNPDYPFFMFDETPEYFEFLDAMASALTGGGDEEQSE